MIQLDGNVNMKDKLTKPKDIKKLRQAFNIQYSRFAKDFNELGERFRKIVIDADLVLAAAEEMMDL